MACETQRYGPLILGAAAILLAVCSLPAAAMELGPLDTAKSFVRFVVRQMNVPVEGRFKTMRAKVGFDPDRPQSGRAEVEVDLASVDTGSDEADAEVRGKGWFDVAAYPTARFVSSGLRLVAPGRYEIRGTLSIKGRNRPVAAVFALTRAGDLSVMDGEFPLKRLQFGIGEGEWSDPEMVADEVTIRFRLAFLPNPSNPNHPRRN